MRRKPVWLHLVEVRSEAKKTHLSYLQLRSEFLFRCTMIDIRTRAWFPFRTTEKEEMESKHLRVQCSSLMGLRQLLLALPASQIDDGLKGHLRGLLNDGKFWNLSKSSLVLVRGSYCWLWKGAILADLDQAKVFTSVGVFRLCPEDIFWTFCNQTCFFICQVHSGVYWFIYRNHCLSVCVLGFCLEDIFWTADRFVTRLVSSCTRFAVGCTGSHTGVTVSVSPCVQAFPQDVFWIAEPFATAIFSSYTRFTVGCICSYSGISVCLSMCSGFVWKISSELLNLL